MLQRCDSWNGAAIALLPIPFSTYMQPSIHRKYELVANAMACAMTCAVAGFVACAGA